MRKYFVAVVFIVSACTPNPYARFYEGAPDGRVTPGYVASQGQLAIYSTTDFTRDGRELMRRGFALIGQSSFNAGMNSIKESQLRKQAGNLGAEVVLVASSYTNTVAGALPLSIPTTTTSTTTGTATAHGPGGTVTASGRGTTTTTGSSTVMIPYSVARGDFGALYFVRTRPRIGLYVLALDDSAKRRLGSNFGARVDIVVQDSPAFDADVLPGDILLQIGDVRVRSPEHFVEIAKAAPPGPIRFVIDRDGKSVTRTVGIRRE